MPSVDAGTSETGPHGVRRRTSVAVARASFLCPGGVSTEIVVWPRVGRPGRTLLQVSGAGMPPACIAATGRTTAVWAGPGLAPPVRSVLVYETTRTTDSVVRRIGLGPSRGVAVVADEAGTRPVDAETFSRSLVVWSAGDAGRWWIVLVAGAVLLVGSAGDRTEVAEISADRIRSSVRACRTPDRSASRTRIVEPGRPTTWAGAVIAPPTNNSPMVQAVTTIATTGGRFDRKPLSGPTVKRASVQRFMFHFPQGFGVAPTQQHIVEKMGTGRFFP